MYCLRCEVFCINLLVSVVFSCVLVLTILDTSFQKLILFSYSTQKTFSSANYSYLTSQSIFSCQAYTFKYICIKICAIHESLVLYKSCYRFQQFKNLFRNLGRSYSCNSSTIGVTFLIFQHNLQSFSIILKSLKHCSINNYSDVLKVTSYVQKLFKVDLSRQMEFTFSNIRHICFESNNFLVVFLLSNHINENFSLFQHLPIN